VGLYAYAHARWGLRAPTYASLPVQAMGKMAVTEEVESLRAEESIEQDIGQEEVKDDEERDFAREAEAKAEREKQKRGKRIATLKEVQAAFDSLTTLRYSQPIHLSGWLLA
jgi:cleavage and polyadenylation specificity factor subunit 2